jgi:hypothetical protein
MQVSLYLFNGKPYNHGKKKHMENQNTNILNTEN